MYSDNWLKQGYTNGNRIKVSDTVNYQVWSDNNGAAVGVTVNFETADDFHYDLLIADWNRILVEVLCSPKAIAPKDAFRDYLLNNKGLFDFEEALKTHDIKFEKIAFY